MFDFIKEYRLPETAIVSQEVNSDKINDIRGTIKNELNNIGLSKSIKKDEKIGITVGSRGIANLKEMLNIITEEIKIAGGKAVIIPSMGSHGGGTRKGQKDMLTSLGINENDMQVPIIASADTIKIGKTKSGIPVYVNEIVAQEKIDKIVLFNRIKEHTEFDGNIESGLHKICAIGLGNPEGALTVHQWALNIGYEKVIREIGDYIIKKLPIIFAIGVVENYYHQTANIRAIRPENIYEEEKQLLIEAKNNLGKLPFSNIDILIIDEMGKNISGTGIDTNIIGRRMVLGQKEPEGTDIKRIIVLDMTEESHGTVTGIGLADFTSKRLIDKISRSSTYLNCITAQTPEKARIPMWFNNDRECINAALSSIGNINPEDAKIVHIKNTNEVKIMEISRELYRVNNKDLSVSRSFSPIKFDKNNNLSPICNIKKNLYD